MRIPGISLRPITGRRAGNGWSRPTTEGMKNQALSLCPKGKLSSLGCQRNGWKGESVAGCRLVVPPVVKPVARKQPDKCRISGLFLFLTTKATEKQKENQSEQKTESRGLCAEFFSPRCQAPTCPAVHATTPGRKRSGYLYGGKCLWQNKQILRRRTGRKIKKYSLSFPVSLRGARPCGKPLSSLLSGRPVNGLRNGKSGKPAKGRKPEKNGNPA